MTDPRQDSTPDAAEQVSPHALSAALAALGAYDQPPTGDQLDAPSAPRAAAS